ncbi:MAG: flagellar biosynthesis protein FlhF [Syntrophaceae bacterium]|jgi:flagellar biosynthesis protein FlhF|nr:flagellar biosynthesis protein FlhF [Syntrophaceae bacterium]
MRMKRYEVAAMNDAMAKIKTDLGPEAIILSARKIRSGKNEVFEVVAARDDDFGLDRPPVKEDRPSFSAATDEPLAAIRKEIGHVRQAVEEIRTSGRLADELAEMKETLNAFFDVLGMRQGRAPQDLNARIYRRLLQSGFSRAGACRIVEAIGRGDRTSGPVSEADALALAGKHIALSLPSARKNTTGKRIRMLIGPTGVGKTTTLAKLAARQALVEKRKVGLISTDNVRVAAGEQLGAYARIMGLPMECASTPEAFEKAIRRFADRDVVLVDTPGRARPDDAYLLRMAQALPDETVETNLLMNATGSGDYLERLVTDYGRLRVDQLIITKIDESRRFGSLYDVIVRAARPVAYLTGGQNVPQDIEEASPLRMAKLMLSGAANS